MEVTRHESHGFPNMENLQAANRHKQQRPYLKTTSVMSEFECTPGVKMPPQTIQWGVEELGHSLTLSSKTQRWSAAVDPDHAGPVLSDQTEH